MKLINKNDEIFAKKELEKLYDNKKAPAEKKEYLTDLKNGRGPYFAVETSDGSPHYFMDAASQIATLGLGFNPSSFFGTNHLEECWTNEQHTQNFLNLKKSLNDFFQRKLGWNNVHMSFTNSGAESNEVALGLAYKNRANKNAKKVLCFEGSFHGRMMVALMSTWNQSKRAPFEWPGFESIYAPFPEDKSGQALIKADKEWLRTWENAVSRSFTAPKSNDELVQKEIESLTYVRDQIKNGEIFAVIVEPMQCEGGDRYATNRFFQALSVLCKSYGVAIIFDEVQTGFHLGRDFFWHKEFQLQNSMGEEILPDYVTCAKKAQTGIVLSPIDGIENREVSVASIYRGYIHALMMDQMSDDIIDLEKRTEKKLYEFCRNHADYVTNPRVHGMAFGFDLKDKAHVNDFIKHRFEFGLLYYPAGDETLRFRLNTAYRDSDMDFLFKHMDLIARRVFKNEEVSPLEGAPEFSNKVEDTYFWQEIFIEARLLKLAGKSASSLVKMAKEWIEDKTQFTLTEITHSNFAEYKNKIVALEKEVYEPARQTEIEKFEKTVTHKNSLSYALEKDGKILAISFAGPMKLYPLERGLRKDVNFENENCLYMLDTTASNNMQGKGLGTYLKNYLFLNGIEKNIKKINGRNRDHMARAMFSINLSLGAVLTDYMREDYPDFEQYRDVLYYNSTTEWNKTTNFLSSAINAPMGLGNLDVNYCKEQLPSLINKICLSNFISKRFSDFITKMLSSLPPQLRHSYTASGQSECVDKIARSIWYNQDENKKSFKNITFNGHYFGKGSFVSRSLSYEDEFFPVTKITCPTVDKERSLKELESALKNEKFLALWLEPLISKKMERISKDTLREILKIAKKYNTPVVYNETASSLYRYDMDSYSVSNIEELRPNAVMIFMGGQAAICAMEEQFFIDKPLMVISTWDGDEFSFGSYLKAKEAIENDISLYKKTVTQFQNELGTLLNHYPISKIDLDSGVGHFRGHIPLTTQVLFEKIGENYIVCPSYEQMKKFLKY